MRYCLLLLLMAILTAQPAFAKKKNPCAGVSCSGAGTCVVAAHGGPACTCFPGYGPDPSGLNCLPAAEQYPDSLPPSTEASEAVIGPSTSTLPYGGPPANSASSKKSPRYAVILNPIDLALSWVFGVMSLGPQFQAGILKYLSVELHPVWFRLIGGDDSKDGSLDTGGLMVGLRFNTNWLRGFYVIAKFGVVGGRFMRLEYDVGSPYLEKDRIAIVPFQSGIGGAFTFGKKRVKFVMNVGCGYRGLFPLGNHDLSPKHSLYLEGAFGVGWG
jgi:hypothetical protein